MIETVIETVLFVENRGKVVGGVREKERDRERDKGT